MAAHAFVMKTFLRRARNAILRVIAKISQETGVFGNSCHALRLSLNALAHPTCGDRCYCLV